MIKKINYQVENYPCTREINSIVFLKNSFQPFWLWKISRASHSSRKKEEREINKK